MILSNYYWYYQNAIPVDVCNKIIKLALKNKKELGLIGDISKADTKKKTIVSNMKKKRNSNIVWLDNKWIYELVHNFLFDANKKSGWNFDVDFTELIQFTIYKQKQYYDWHVDQNALPYSNHSNDNYNGKIRKLSMSILLNNPNEFKGGQLEFDTPNGLFVCKELNSQGSLVVFPSNVKHRVNPVTKGTRYSLVSWTLGLPFK